MLEILISKKSILDETNSCPDAYIHGGPLIYYVNNIKKIISIMAVTYSEEFIIDFAVLISNKFIIKSVSHNNIPMYKST